LYPLNQQQVFNNEVGAYNGWTLFLIFLSILVLIAGVVLLTLKKPEPAEGKIKSATLSAHPRRTPIRSARPRSARSARIDLESHGENEDDGERNNERDVLWEVGHASDDDDQGEDEDIDHHQHPLYSDDGQRKGQTRANSEGGEGVELVPSNGGEDLLRRYSLGDATKKNGSWHSADVDRQHCRTS